MAILKYLISLTLIIHSLDLYSQTNKYDIVYRIYDIKKKEKIKLRVNEFSINQDDSTYKILTQQSVYLFKFLDTLFMGNTKIFEYDKKGHLKGLYTFKDGLGILKEQILCEDVGLDNPIILLNNYYESIPIGEWFYYKKNGKLKKKISFIWG